MSAPLSSDLSKVAPALAWQPWLPDQQQPWNAKWAAHLYRRAGFGCGPSDIERALKEGYSSTVERLLQGGPDVAKRDEMFADLGEEFVRSDDVFKLRGWWLYRMMHNGHPLREKLTLLWHNHFATSIRKVQSPYLMFRQNQLLRQHALGSFRPFLREMSRDVAMLLWLDSNQNVKAHPNENYAREVMELFSLGVGNYTEKDIQEAARAFTGWHTDSSARKFEFNEEEHDDGRKSVLGVSGRWNGDDVLKILLDQPAAALFLAGKLYRELVSETEPPKALLEPLAEQFRQADYNIADLLKTILRSRMFFSEHAYLKRIKSPVEFVLGAVQAAWPGPIAPSQLVTKLEAMGQELFAPPNVKGWPGAKSWLNDATLLARNNFAEAITRGSVASLPGRPRNADERVFATIAPEPKKKGPPPEEVEPPEKFDSSNYARNNKATAPKDVVARLAEQYFPGGFSPNAAAKLQAFIADGNPKDKEFNRRIREAAHAMMCMPEYQLC